jgi:hypothetical protein
MPLWHDEQLPTVVTGKSYLGCTNQMLVNGLKD